MAYEALGTVGEQKTFYAEGSIFHHPSGHYYKRIEGRWVHLASECCQ